MSERPDWIERMSGPERDRHFRHYTAEQFRAWIGERIRRGIPEKCDDETTLTQVGLLVGKAGPA